MPCSLYTLLCSPFCKFFPLFAPAEASSCTRKQLATARPPEHHGPTKSPGSSRSRQAIPGRATRRRLDRVAISAAQHLSCEGEARPPEQGLLCSGLQIFLAKKQAFSLKWEELTSLQKIIHPVRAVSSAWLLVWKVFLVLN